VRPYFRISAHARTARATKDENGGAQWSMINGQFSMGERHATRITQYAPRSDDWLLATDD